MPSPTPTIRLPGRWRRLAVTAAITALFGQFLTGSGAAEPARSPAPRAIAWHSCADAEPDYGTFECGTVKVPMDWNRPQGATVEVAVARHLATDPKKRIGSLLFNPGGPGASGVAWAMAPWEFPSNSPPVSTSWVSTRAASAAVSPR